MKVLIACEYSGIVREAFIKRGHDAMSCDLLPTEQPGPHYQGDVFDCLEKSGQFDLMIAHPPCTYLTSAGAIWFDEARYGEKARQRKMNRIKAVEFVKKLSLVNIPMIAIENPIGNLSSMFRKPDQIIQPYWFGHRQMKSTCLWLKGLPKLVPTKIVAREYITITDGRRYPKWSYDTFKLPKSIRWKERSKTFQGVADAMAEQWSNHNNN